MVSKPICYWSPQMRLVQEQMLKITKSPHMLTRCLHFTSQNITIFVNFRFDYLKSPPLPPPPAECIGIWFHPDLASTHHTVCQTIFSDPNLSTVKNLYFTPEWGGVVSAF